MGAQKYAIIDGTKVVNVILLDINDHYIPPSGLLLLAAPNDVSIGWTKEGENWIAPQQTTTPIPVESPDDVAAKTEAAQELIDAGISEVAARRIVGLPT
jgi:hypothetical protein